MPPLLSPLLALLLLLSPCLCSPLDTLTTTLLSSLSTPVYSVHTGPLSMDCLKVLPSLNIGIFHSSNPATHYSQLYYAQHNKQTNQWGNAVRLSQRGSQGVIVEAQNGGLLVGYELENHSKGNTIAIRYYQNQSKLKANNFLYQYQLYPLVSSRLMRNIGTVSLQQLHLLQPEPQPKYNQYLLNIRFHYSPDGIHDYPGYGQVYLRPLRDFVNPKTSQWIGGCKQQYRDWSGYVDKQVQGAMRYAGCLGKIGQRDYFYVSGVKYYLYECNLNPEFDWYSWRIVIYSPMEKKAKVMPLVLGGAVDIANPHVSLVKNQGREYQFVMSFFIPSQAIKEGMEARAGECVVGAKFVYP